MLEEARPVRFLQTMCVDTDGFRIKSKGARWDVVISCRSKRSRHYFFIPTKQKWQRGNNRDRTHPFNHLFTLSRGKWFIWTRRKNTTEKKDNEGMDANYVVLSVICCLIKQVILMRAPIIFNNNSDTDLIFNYHFEWLFGSYFSFAESLLLILTSAQWTFEISLWGVQANMSWDLACRIIS